MKFLGAFFLALGLFPASAQYSIDWFSIDGGGGTSTGGVYSVSGTIGQNDASVAPMTGGEFSLTGGFWSLYIVPTTGAPALNIRFSSPTVAQIYWPSPSTGWDLQSNNDLSTTNWVAVGENVSDDGTNKFISINAPAGTRFYRLIKP